jgi:hypothetical protein
MTTNFHPSLGLISRTRGKKVLARKPQKRRCLGILSLIFSFFTIPLLLSGQAGESGRETQGRKKGRKVKKPPRLERRGFGFVGVQPIDPMPSY